MKCLEVDIYMLLRFCLSAPNPSFVCAYVCMKLELGLQKSPSSFASWCTVRLCQWKELEKTKSGGGRESTCFFLFEFSLIPTRGFHLDSSNGFQQQLDPVGIGSTSQHWPHCVPSEVPASATVNPSSKV